MTSVLLCDIQWFADRFHAYEGQSLVKFFTSLHVDVEKRGEEAAVQGVLYVCAQVNPDYQRHRAVRQVIENSVRHAMAVAQGREESDEERLPVINKAYDNMLKNKGRHV